MPQRPSGTVTFLFTDIEGSTQLWDRHPVEMEADLATHDALMRTVVERHEGHVFKTVGDAFCVAFSRPAPAIEAAAAAQRALGEQAWRVPSGIKVRMAIHAGVADERDGDYFGPTLNRTARILGVGHGGQVLVSTAVSEIVGGELPAGVWLIDLGQHRLRDLSRPAHIHQLGADSLTSLFPPLVGLETFRHNLPIRPSRFVGREQELLRAHEAFGSARLVTVVGPGGAGKTRFGLQLAAELVDEFPDGTWLAELAPVADAAAVERELAAILEVHEDPEKPLVEVLLDHLSRRQALLLLDNCEHVVDACASLVGRLLAACPGVTVLATSRRPLSVEGECVYELPPLPTPAAGDPGILQAAGGSSLELFADRAASVRPGFQLTDDNAITIARICRRLDGIPLAIELAAARARLLSVEQIAELLDQRFRLLVGGRRGGLPHHKTLRAAIDWSYDLLDGSEKSLFQRLSVFPSSWSMGAAEAVCSSDELDAWAVLDLLSQLVDRSLVCVEEGSAEHHYYMLESLRAYASEELGDGDERLLLQGRHLAFYSEQAARLEKELHGSEQAASLAAMARNDANYRAALEYSMSPDVAPTALGVGEPPGMALAVSLTEYWRIRGHFGEGRRWLGRALSQPSCRAPSHLRAEALVRAGQLATAQWDYASAATHLDDGLTLMRELGDRQGEAQALSDLGVVADKMGRRDEATRLHTESLALRRELGDERGVAASLNNLAAVAYHAGDFEEARRQYENSLELLTAMDDPYRVGIALYNLATLALDERQYVEARGYFERSLDKCRAIEDSEGICLNQMGLAKVAVERGEAESARETYLECREMAIELADLQLIIEWLEGVGATALVVGDAAQGGRAFGTAEMLRETEATPVLPSEEAPRNESLAALRAALGDEAFSQAWREGRGTDWRTAVAQAIG